MAGSRLVFWLFCEKHLTDAQGRNSFINVFDTMSITVSTTSPVNRVMTMPFVLALRLEAPVDDQPSFEVRVLDSDGQRVLPVQRGVLSQHPEGRHWLHLNYQNGLPIVRGGIIAFEIAIAGEVVGTAELPISMEVFRAGGRDDS